MFPCEQAINTGHADWGKAISLLSTHMAVISLSFRQVLETCVASCMENPVACKYRLHAAVTGIRKRRRELLVEYG